jgi:sortase A
MAVGTLMLLFVAYELWGTGISEARSQKDLGHEFKQAQSQAPPVNEATTLNPPALPAGGAVAVIKIPKIGVEKTVVEGVGVPDLKRGPGHYPDTPMPGQQGNAAIAGHRTTYGAPFYNLDQLKPSDPILITTLQGSFRYEVMGTQIVRPSEVSVLDNTPDNRLTLTTCHPRFSASSRMVVTAKLIGVALPAPAPDTSTAAPETDPAGLSGGTTARAPAVLWGLAFVAIWAGAYGVRRWIGHKWIVWAVAAIPMAVTLFIFFENFQRLLPANV